MLDQDAVNTDLNSQEWPIPPGDYHWASIIMCNQDERGSLEDETYGTGEDNVFFETDGMGTEHSDSYCDPYSGYSETPITVSEGGSITVTLNYDVNKLMKWSEHNEGYSGEHVVGPSNWGGYNTAEGNGRTYTPDLGQGAFVPTVQ